MLDLLWLESLFAGAVCLGAGTLAVTKFPKSKAAGFFMLSMASVFVAMITGPLFLLVADSAIDVANAIAKTFTISGLLAGTLLWQMTMFFPVERNVSLRPPNALGLIMIGSVAAAVALGSMSSVRYEAGQDPALAPLGGWLLAGNTSLAISIMTASSLLSKPKMDPTSWRSTKALVAALLVFVACGLPVLFFPGVTSAVVLTTGIAVSGLILASAIMTGQLSVVSMAPVPERFTSSTKSSYKLLHRRVYLVEETKPSYSFKVFTEVLKSRCFDCENDESFPCESIECGSCMLPCPCRSCRKYKTRAHGMVITRQFPRDIRAKHYLQTTPIVWLSSVAGKENLDPGKLSVLTDMLVNFMEKSNNGVVMVDGLEYLVTSNDFQRVLKAVDRWTEVAMVSSSRLVMSLDPRAFDARELAMLERDKEIVRPESDETWRMTSGPL